MPDCKTIDCCPPGIYGYQPEFTATASYTALCPVGEVGDPVVVTKTATSQISYQDAYDTALIQAQAEAEEEIVCAFPVPEEIWAWYDSVNVTINSGDVVTISDLTSNNRDLIQLTGDAPSQSLNALNGFPSIVFNGTSDRLTYSGDVLGNPACFFIVARLTGNPGNASALLGTGATGYTTLDFSLFCADDADAGQIYQRGTKTPTSTMGIENMAYEDVGSFFLLMSNLYPTAVESFQRMGDDAESKTGDFNSAVTLNRLTLGSRSSGESASSVHCPLEFVEMMVFNRPLESDSGDGLMARRYLNWKYNLGLVI